MDEKKERSTGDIIEEAGRFSCPVQKAAYYADSFLRDLMCGRCLPCALGVHEAKLLLQEMVAGGAREGTIDALRRIAEALRVGSRCKRGRDTAHFLLEMLSSSAFSAHVQGRCPDRECAAYYEVRIEPAKCIMCGECRNVCAYRAVSGEVRVAYMSGYLPFEILPKRCTRCGECLKVCPTRAIVVVDGGELVGTGRTDERCSLV